MAQWSTAFINNLPDASFLYIEPGGSKDSEGKTTPRSLRHFPVKDANGNVDMPHLRNALARIPQSSLSDAVKAEATAKANRLMAANRSVRPLDTFWRAAGPDSLDLQRSGRGNPILSGELAVFNQWTEIRSPIEGHFMEQIAPGAFKKTLADRADRIRVIFQHGREQPQGEKPLGKILDMPNDGSSQRYEVELFQVSYVDDLLPALANGQFGSSFSARDIKSSSERRPEPSDQNPDGIEQVTRNELMLREFGPVTFPAYEQATAGLRSVTEDAIQPMLAEMFAALGLEIPVIRAAALEPEEPEQPEEGEETEDESSRSTREQETSEQTPEEVAEPSWRL